MVTHFHPNCPRLRCAGHRGKGMVTLPLPGGKGCPCHIHSDGTKTDEPQDSHVTPGPFAKPNTLWLVSTDQSRVGVPPGTVGEDPSLIWTTAAKSVL